MAAKAERILPPELWSMVTDSLPYSSKIQALGVSSLLHDILVPQLFSSIRIYISTPEMQDLFNQDDFDVEEMMRRSWEKLNHIAMNPKFARIVKSFTVSVYGQHPLYFEMCKHTDEPLHCGVR